MSHGCVLILDGNRVQAQRISTMLHQQKWTSVLSFDPKMAVRNLKSSRYHLLLFDAFVEGASTMQIVDQIREFGQEAPLAIMSDQNQAGRGQRTTADMARAAGADFVVPKPFNERGLKTLLADTNSYHRARMKERHVVVVEDDPHLRHDICRVLKQVGYAVSSAGNIEDVLFDHNLGMIDLLLTAVLIPGIGGIEGTAQIKKDWPHVKVIAMSEGVDEKITALHVLSAAKAAGADALLPKPFHMPELLKTVAGVLKVRETDDEEANSAAQDAIDAIFAR